MFGEMELGYTKKLTKHFNAENAFVFRITHIDNVKWILENGLHCINSDIQDPNFISIGHKYLIKKRKQQEIPSGGKLADYIPFYFTPYSPMLYAITEGNFKSVEHCKREEIVILTASLKTIAAKQDIKFTFTDQHAYLKSAEFYSSLDELKKIQWKILQDPQNFKKNYRNPKARELYQAEALIRGHLPLEYLRSMICYGEKQKRFVEEERDKSGANLKIVADPDCYFR